MSFEESDVVVSLCGKDKGRLFFILSIADGYAMIADGRTRRLEKPKRKKLRHLKLLERDGGRVAVKLRQNERVTNAELRRALSDITGEPEEQGGMHIG